MESGADIEPNTLYTWNIKGERSVSLTRHAPYYQNDSYLASYSAGEQTKFLY